MPLPIEEVERRVREQLGLFAKGEQPQQPPSLFKQFVGEAMVPAGLAIRAGSSAPLPSRAPLSPAGAQTRLTPADYNAARAQLPSDASLAERTAAARQIAQQRSRSPSEMTANELYAELQNIPTSSPDLMQGLTPRQREHVQRLFTQSPDADIRAYIANYRQGNLRESADNRRHVQNAFAAQDRQFDINRFRPPERGRTKPGMSAVQGEVSATYGEAGAPGPGYGELGNFLEPPIPGRMQKPSALAERLAQLPSPARRDLGYEMPISEIRKGQRDWGISYEPPGGSYGAIQASVDPRERVLQISGSQLPKSAQGKGIGQEMYRRLIDEAHREGLQVRSDNILSPYSNRIYERVLTGQGYDVKRNPYATKRNYGTYPHEVDEGGVYSVGPKERLPAPRLLDMLLRVPKKSPYAIAPFAGVPLGMPQMEDD